MKTGMSRLARAVACFCPGLFIACSQGAPQDGTQQAQGTPSPSTQTQRRPERARVPASDVVRGHVAKVRSAAQVKSALQAVLPSMVRPEGSSVTGALADTVPDIEVVNQTLADGTVVTGTIDHVSGAFSLVYTFPDGSVGNVAGTTTTVDGVETSVYTVDTTYGDGVTTEHWDITQVTTTLPDGSTTQTVSAHGTVAGRGESLPFTYESTETRAADGTLTLSESFDDLSTAASPDGQYTVTVHVDGSISLDYTMADPDGVTHHCVGTGTLPSDAMGNLEQATLTAMNCDGQDIPPCALDDSCGSTSTDGGVVTDCPPPLVPDGRGGCVDQGGPPPDLVIGAGADHFGFACAVDTDCGGGLCMTAEQADPTVFPHGYCITACRVDTDCGDGVCLAASDRPEDPGICGRLCAVDAECGAIQGGVCRQDLLGAPPDADGGVPATAGLCVAG